MGAAPPPLPRIVILDYYDSYTNNLLTLFTSLYGNKEVLDKVVVIKADHYEWDEFKCEVLPNVDCVILSPGPGRPDNPKDIGFALELLREHSLPILGVCLGHQAIGVAFGGKIAHAPIITHGQVVRVSPVQPPIGLFAAPIFEDEPLGDSYEVVVYNSLVVDEASLPDELEVTAWSAQEGTRSIQGLRHKQYPIWGLQYHPESISSTRGTALLHAFLLEVHNHHSKATSYPALKERIVSSCAYRVSASGFTTNGRNTPRAVYPSPPGTPPLRQSVLAQRLAEPCWNLAAKRLGKIGAEWVTSDAFERLIRDGKQGVGHVWLDGQSPSRPTTTTLAAPSCLVTYSLAKRTVTLHQPSKPTVKQVIENETFWDYFSTCQQELSGRLARAAPNSRERSRFLGGWIGWFGYEMKEESLVGHLPRRGVDFADWAEEEDVDACWAWVGSFVERTGDGEWIVRGVVGGQDLSSGSASDGGSGLLGWLESQGVCFTLSPDEYAQYAEEVTATLSRPHAGSSHPIADKFPAFHPIITGAQHRDSIDQCREAIRQGDSYELTLTTRFDATLPPSPSSSSQNDTYSLYLKLRARNPAYYSTYISFPSLSTPKGQGLHVVSSSPERFLKIDEKRQVEMMPIKGTLARVKPGQCVCPPDRGCRGLDKGSAECDAEGRAEDARRADWLRKDKKERAENLMIVDLIRSDLLSCCIPSTVKVPKLIALESYGVHHLVTTVTGLLAENVGPVDAVKRCFPPGSMTGAPKLRSVQLLEEYESRRRRGIYSGALGYFSLDGAVDLSVVIRTIIVEGDRMSIGSGGGITWLSNRDSEWEEVLTKVRSVVGELEDVQ